MHEGSSSRPIRNTVLALLVALTGSSHALQTGRIVPDVAREHRMAAEIVDAILDGEPLQIGLPGNKAFLGIHTQSAMAPAKGIVVILHGRGMHPDWSDVVHPLRVGLPAFGWDTLSVQMPVLDKEAQYDDYVQIFPDAMPRIEAALTEARALSSGKVVLLAHSCGSHMAQHWINARPALAAQLLDAFVGIGMGATDAGQPMREPFALGRLAVPMLDLYAEHDYRAVQRLAPVRLAAMRRGGHPLNVQRVVGDAGHYFVDRGDALTAAVADWLDRL